MNVRNLLTTVFAVAAAFTANSAVKINSAQGWLETAWVEWSLFPGATAYNVYVSENGADNWTKLDDELIRNYGTYGRADALGLKADTYSLKVVPVVDGAELTAEASVAGDLVVKPHDRTGYAHFGRPVEGLYEGVGAYRNDGTLKDNAIVMYVTANTAKTISVTWPRNGKPNTFTGLYSVIEGYRKCLAAGDMKQPLNIRIIGTITDSDMDKLRFGQGLDIKGETAYSEFPFTLEGVGNDATIWGFGVQFSQVTGAEMRNIGILHCKEDGVECNKNNSHL